MIELAIAAALMAQDARDFCHDPDGTTNCTVGLVQGTRILRDLPSANCEELESSTTHENCALQPTDGRDVMAAFTFTEGEWVEDGRMAVSTSSRQILQVFDFETESFFYPSMEDINDDGLQDIRIPLVTGNVNTEYAIFMGTEDGFLHQPWQVSGFAVESANYDSLIIARSRSSAAESYAEFYRFDGEQVIGEATVLLSFMNVENPDDGPDCSLVDGGEYEGEHFYCSLALNP